jgi:hypothetical protein
MDNKLVRSALITALFVSLLAGAPALAGVIDVADVTIGSAQFRAFQDTSTNLTWLDLDNFFQGYSYNLVAFVLAVSGSGFHIATLTEVQTLEASIPAVPANFAAEAVIIGANYPGNPHAPGGRSIMWGCYAADGETVSYAFRYEPYTDWAALPGHILKTDLLSSALPDFQDLGVWVVSDSAATNGSVPEPGTFALLGLGLGAFVAARRIRQRG